MTSLALLNLTFLTSFLPELQENVNIITHLDE